MSTHAAPPDEATSGPKRIKPHQLALGLGIGIAVFTAMSGVLPLITEWHNENEWHREVFGNIPGPLKLAFYTVIPLMLVWGAFQFSNRMKNWERGGPAQRRTTAKNAKTRAEHFRAGVYMQTLLRDSAAGLMHSMIYFGFLVLLGVTTVLEIDHQVPEGAKFLPPGVQTVAQKLYGLFPHHADVFDGIRERGDPRLDERLRLPCRQAAPRSRGRSGTATRRPSWTA